MKKLIFLALAALPFAAQSQVKIVKDSATGIFYGLQGEDTEGDRRLRRNLAASMKQTMDGLIVFDKLTDDYFWNRIKYLEVRIKQLEDENRRYKILQKYK